MRRVSILGATGSIGSSALEVLRDNKELFAVEVLTAGSNVSKLACIAREFKPKVVVIADKEKYNDLKAAVSGLNIAVMAGEEGLIEASSYATDITLSAIVGLAALKPTMAALAHTKVLALANKESLVCAGELLLAKAHQYGVKVIPVDSEHSALFQVFETNNAHKVRNIVITASGGAFRNMTYDQMREVTPQMALRHPTWDMGAKITVDCATLANKGLEYIEACVLFPIQASQVKVLIHPQSIIHGLVQYEDGGVLAQLSVPDMKTPISYALAYPERLTIQHKPLNLAEIGALSFEEPDYQRFPMLRLAQEVCVLGQDALVTFNVANEVAVEAFLQSRLKFLDIYKVVQECVANRINTKLADLGQVYEYQDMVQRKALELVNVI